jgi:hypothetical protein
MAKKKDLIEGRAYRSHQIDPHNKDGFGFHPETGEFKVWENIQWMHEVFDSIAAAVEAGVVDRNRWVSQFFADEEIFKYILREVSDYEQCFRIRDRWYEALHQLTGLIDEEGCVTGEEITERLIEAAEETGQIET